MSTRAIVVLTTKHVVAERVRAAARAAGLEVVAASAAGELDALDEPDALVVDLDIERSLEIPAAVRERWPRALLAGFVSVPDRSRWEAAAARGYDLVSTRGAVGVQVLKTLDGWEGPKRTQLVRLFAADDAAGRLGLVYRTAETPVGPIAVYQIGKDLYAVGDVCPHAGAALSEGELNEGIVTCPLHGSRFDVRTGERVRGPSDEPIPCYRVVVEDGTVAIELEPEQA